MQPPARISATAAGLTSTNAKHVQTERHQAAWDGVIYRHGGVAEEPLVAQILSELESGRTLLEIAESLRGCFFLVIWDPQRKTAHAFIDPNGLYSAYRGTAAVGNSFLALSALGGYGVDDINPLALTEFLQTGNVYFGDTLLPGIQKIAPNQLITVGPDGLQTTQRTIPQLTDSPKYHDLVAASEPVAEMAKGMSLSVDLTGGFDSRMLACLMKYHGVPFEVAISGKPGHIDIVLAEQVAAAIDRPFFFSSWDAADVVEDLDETLTRLDGLCGVISGCHRLAKMADDRHQRGINLIFKGSGGELYKDFFWTQDFPFYWSQHSRLGRLHRLRMEFELLSQDVLTPEYYRAFEAAREQRLQRLQQYVLPKNTQTYDNIYFRERVQTWNSRFFTSCQRKDVATHSPLCETEMVQVGFHAARRMRFYNRLHRQTISQICPAAAAIKTTDGTTASSRPWDLLMDGAGYASVKLRKLLKKSNQLLLNRTRFDAPSLAATDRILTSDVARDALVALIDLGVLQPDVTFDKIAPRFREHVVALGWTLRHLQSGVPAARQ